MCRWRHVRNLYLRCNHAENLRYGLKHPHPAPNRGIPGSSGLDGHNLTMGILEGQMRKPSVQIQPEPPAWVSAPFLQQVLQPVTIDPSFVAATSSLNNIHRWILFGLYSYYGLWTSLLEIRGFPQSGRNNLCIGGSIDFQSSCASLSGIADCGWVLRLEREER
ncbi:hypothetical protein B0H14DRAFT_2577835 [Mycena olivaceomarginata]|nr:hypothetical protein B0H14DRAFT_2577835 [Mycena olivaceomarginata]